MKILLTGGTGYIGSHTAVVLSEAGHEVVLLDNFCNSNRNVLNRLEKILGKALPCIEADVRETKIIENVLHEYQIDAVIHFAGLKAVGESVEKPVEYYANNVQGTISLLEAMKSSNVKTLVFSSSATVYGDPQYLPIDESHPTSATNAYGRSKLHIEEMLKDVANSDVEWKIICLRYFNPVGAHESGLIGEHPNGIPNNLVPYILKVASQQLPYLSIYGDDYGTRDGTGERDYIHVMDLAEGHLCALENIHRFYSWQVFNLGTGRSYSVLEIVKAFERFCKAVIPCQLSARRRGDIASCFANSEKALKELGWTSKRDLEAMCSTAWKYFLFDDNA